MPWCPYHPGGHIKSALRKKTNIKDTCCINIKTKADKEEEGQEEKEDFEEKLVQQRTERVIQLLYIVQGSSAERKTDLK